MTLPPLYKYLDVNGAKLTLGTRTFRHAKPSDYRDLEDMTIRSIFPVEVEVALVILSAGVVDIIVANLNEQPTCSAKLAAVVTTLQEILRQNPEQADILREQMRKLPELKAVFDAEAMRVRSEAFVNATNEFMQSYRILCVTTDNGSERMWEDYAQDHLGAVVRIEPNVEKASKFELFRPVEYRAARPALYDQTLDFLEGSLFGDQQARSRAILDKIIYAKTLPYKFEKEYRLAVPVGEEEGDWSTLPYHPEEVTELYLGLGMTEEDKHDIVGKAKAVNPCIAIFQAIRDANRKLAFRQTR
jgi:hypothetical protein